MVRKKNLLNVLIVIIALILVLAISLHLFAMEEKTLNFSGANIYRAVYVYDAMEHQGFLVNLDVTGYWTDTNELFEDSALILDATKGNFLVLYEDREIAIGGPTSTTEDIAAEQLILKPLNKELIKLGLEPISYSNLATLNSKLERLSLSLLTKEEIYDVGIRGDVMIDTDTTLKPTIIQKIENLLKPRNEITLYNNGIQLSLENANLDDLKAINELLSNEKVSSTDVATSRLEVLVRTKSTIGESTDTLLNKAEQSDFEIYMLRLISDPIQ